jgi:uncharacterized membrane protein
MMKYSLFFCFSFLLFACNNSDSSQEIVSQDTSVVITGDSAIVSQTYRGLFLNYRFYSCDNLGETYHVNDNTGGLDSAYAYVTRNYFSSSIVIQVKGKLKRGEKGEFNGELIVDSLISAEGKSYKNTCIPYDFWCMGNEPFWQIQISEKENCIDFYNPMEQQRIHFNYKKSENINNTVRYTSVEGKNTIEIQIKKEQCSDGMSEKKYNYSVKVKLNENNYSGCAVKYGEMPE